MPLDHFRKSLAFLVTALAATGCYVPTQRFPAPMSADSNTLPPGTADLFPEGPEEVLVVRHADPVQIRPAGLTSSYPLPFYRKQARINSGSWVFSGFGGRLEVLYPDTASIILFGKNTGIVGSSSRGEPLFFFQEIERASVTFTEGDWVELLGGSLLSSNTGPFIIEHPREEILRVRNRSKGEGRVAFRDGIFALDPGQVIDLPILEAGAGPFQRDPSFQQVHNAGTTVEISGALDVVESQSGVRLRASGEHEARGLGVRVRLDDGEEVLFQSLGEGRPGAIPDPPPEPEPDADPDANDVAEAEVPTTRQP